jgi:hypothetical protein
MLVHVIRFLKLITTFHVKISNEELNVHTVCTPFQRLHVLLSLKIRQSCFAHKVTLAAHSMTLLPLQGIVSQGSLISEQNSASYLCGKLSQPANYTWMNIF